MKVFISWSGELSKNLAEILKRWLPAVIQAVKPYYTPDDITKGDRWNTEIAKELEESQVGLICLTRDNLEKPWIMFEAGALSKNLDKSRVCPILFNLTPVDVKGPLVQYQLAQFEKAEMRRVVRMINEALGNAALDAQVLDSVFDMWWPSLKKDIDNELNPKRHIKQATLRTERDLLEEMLELLRNQTKSSGLIDDIPRIALPVTKLTGDLSRGSDVDIFYDSFSLLGTADDPNATQWSSVDNGCGTGSLDGYWSSRWTGGSAFSTWETGTALIKSVDDHLYILTWDNRSPCFIATRWESGNLLIGRYINLLSVKDSTPWVGLIVSNERIDGSWKSGRWDFRRNLSSVKGAAMPESA